MTMMRDQWSDVHPPVGRKRGPAWEAGDSGELKGHKLRGYRCGVMDDQPASASFAAFNITATSASLPVQSLSCSAA